MMDVCYSEWTNAALICGAEQECFSLEFEGPEANGLVGCVGSKETTAKPG